MSKRKCRRWIVITTKLVAGWVKTNYNYIAHSEVHVQLHLKLLPVLTVALSFGKLPSHSPSTPPYSFITPAVVTCMILSTISLSSLPVQVHTQNSEYCLNHVSVPCYTTVLTNTACDCVKHVVIVAESTPGHMVPSVASEKIPSDITGDRCRDPPTSSAVS
jgi:hypothetical protein